MGTTYRKMLPQDRPKVEALWDTTDIPKFPTSFPEIVAERDGEIIGFVAMHHNQDQVLVEPMICPNIHVYIRLWCVLEGELKKAGVETYYFRVAPHHMVGYEHALRGAEARGIIESRGYQHGYYWFQRSISGGKT